MKKGQGLSMNVIIIAAIALLVLVILSVLLLRSTGDLAEGTRCGEAQGTKCALECNEAKGEIPSSGKDDECTGPQVCCIVTG